MTPIDNPNTPEGRIALLKAGVPHKEIQKMYLEQNNILLFPPPSTLSPQ